MILKDFSRRVYKKICYSFSSKRILYIGVSAKDYELVNYLESNNDLTTIDYEVFFLDFIKQEADFAVLTIPYQVSIPYAVLETKDGRIKSLKEKPTYTYFANGGVYLMKKEMLQHIPKDSFFNSTDLMDSLINQDFKVISYPFSGYWLDVGKHEDFEKAQIDIQNLKF